MINQPKPAISKLITEGSLIKPESITTTYQLSIHRPNCLVTSGASGYTSFSWMPPGMVVLSQIPIFAFLLDSYANNLKSTNAQQTNKVKLWTLEDRWCYTKDLKITTVK